MVPVSAFAQEKTIIANSTYEVTVPTDGKPYYTGETPPMITPFNTFTCNSPANTAYTCSGITRDYLDTDAYGYNTLDTSVTHKVTNTDDGWGNDSVTINYGKVIATWTGGNLIVPSSIIVKPEIQISGEGIACSIGLPAGISCGSSPNSAVFSYPEITVTNTSSTTYNTTSFTYDNDDTIHQVTYIGNVTWMFGTNATGQLHLNEMNIADY